MGEESTQWTHVSASGADDRRATVGRW